MDWKNQLYDRYVSTHLSEQPDGDEWTRLCDAARPYARYVIDNHVPTSPDTKILDIGCGSGTLLYLLKEAGYQNLAGLDISEEQVARAHRAGMTEVFHGDLQSYLDRMDGPGFDVIFAMDILEHFDRDDLLEILAQIFAALRPGGRLIAHVPNAEGIFGMRVRYGDLTHEIALTPRSMSQALKTTGFEKTDFHEDRPLTHSPRGIARHLIWRIGTLPWRVLLAAESGQRRPVLSQNMLVVTHKP